MYIITGSLHLVLLTFYEAMVNESCELLHSFVLKKNTADCLQKSIKNVR